MEHDLFEFLEVWVKAEDLLELSEGSELGSIIQSGGPMILDELVKAESVGFQ
jgi:hypothetical protein